MTIPILLLALLPVGQYRACTTATTYGHGYSTSYAQTYAQPYAQPYVEKEIFVAVQQDPYYADLVGLRVKAELKAEERAKTEEALQQRVGSLNETVARLEARLAQLAAQPVAVPQPIAIQPQPVAVPPMPGPAAQPTIPQPPTPDPPAGPSVSAALSDVEIAAAAILRSNCFKCHSGKSAAGGGFAIFDDKGALTDIPPLDKVRIDHSVYAGEMPPGKPPLSPEDYSTVRAWIDESRDEIAAALKNCRANSTPK